jgi:hypothetical protein
MKTEVKICSICGDEYIGWGNNAWPINDRRCCDTCNEDWVIPRRLADSHRADKEKTRHDQD